MKKFLKILIIILTALALVAAGFVTFVNIDTGRGADVPALLSELEEDYLLPVRVEGVEPQAQPDAFTCGAATAAITASHLRGEEITPQALIDKYGLGGGMQADAFEDLLSKELPGYSVAYAGNMPDLNMLRRIHGQLSEGVPVPVFFGAPNPYDEPWYDFHASVVTGLDLEKQEVEIANAYGYAERISLVDFLDRMSYRGGSKYPFIQRAVARLGLMDTNAIVMIRKGGSGMGER